MILRALCVVFCLLLGPSWAEAGISFVNAADLGDNGGASSSLTTAYTVTSGSSMLRISFLGDVTGGADDITSVTYNSVAATLDFKDTGGTASNRIKYNYVIYSPASGSHNVVISASSTHYILAGVSEYKGTGASVDATHSTNGVINDSVTADITTIAPNAWVFAFTEQYNGVTGAPTAFSGATRRSFGVNFQNWGIFDSNAPNNPPGNYEMIIQDTGNTIDFMVDQISFALPQGGGLLTMGCCN